MTVFGDDAPGPGEGPGGGSGIQYLGDVPHARIVESDTTPQGAPLNYKTKGYKKGDQIKLLPKNGADLAALQKALYDAGYFNDAEYKRIVHGSPDGVTATAFAKLLATANMAGTNWRDTLGARLAAAAYEAPGDSAGAGEGATPLRIELSNPEDIKATLNATARKLLGQHMSEEQANAFVAQFQATEAATQTQAATQVGGMMTAPMDPQLQAEQFAKTTDPNQYKATQFGAQVHSALDSLRNSGYLS